MNILIITFSKGLNPGTFMQALGVKTGLLKIYPAANIEYLNFPDFKRGFSPKADSDTLISFIRRKVSGAYRLLKYKRLERKYFKYSSAIDMFDYDATEAKKLLQSYDLIVVGSDTILEKAVSDDNKRVGLNWCASMLSGVASVFFAASASPANYKENNDIITRLKPCIEKINFIGLRDNLTVNLFLEKLQVPNYKLQKQPDPTYLLDVTQFKLSKYYSRKLKDKYIALCNFNPLCPFRADLSRVLRQKGYFVISTTYNPYVDLSIDTVDAKEWAGVFPFVNLVITERFHDSVFALRNSKPVIAIDWNKDRFSIEGDSKTYRILEDYGLTDFHFNFSTNIDINIISQAIDRINNQFTSDYVKQTNEELVMKANCILRRIDM